MIHRETLIKNLETVLPALSDKPLSPVLSHFCFTGKKLYGYNGQIAIIVPCETEFTGAVPKALLAMLKTSGAKEIEIVETKGNIEVKAAAAKFKLATLPPEDFALPFMPKLPDELYEVDAAEFMSALRCCMRSINPNDTSRADFQGVTVIPEKKNELWLFSFNRESISHGIAKGKMANKERAIIPADWCAQALSIAEKADAIEIEIDDEKVLLEYDNVLLYGALVTPDVPLPFVKEVNSRIKLVEEYVEIEEIRPKLEAMLARAQIIAKNGIAKTRTAAEVRDGKLSFKTESEAGDAFDIVTGFEKHPNIKAAIDPGMILDGIKFDQLAITEGGVIMASADDRLVYIVSSADE